MRVAGSERGGAVGVSGTGIGFAGSAFLRRGSSLGMRPFKFGIPPVDPGWGWTGPWALVAWPGTVGEVDVMFYLPFLECRLAEVNRSISYRGVELEV